MLVDLHVHTNAISWCSCADAETMVRTAKEEGFDGIAITNHYRTEYFDEKTYDAWIEKYIEEWDNCREWGTKYNFQVFCGIEVTLDMVDPRVHILIYGADEMFLRKHPRLCDMTLKELYTLCNHYGYAVIQAHPLRGGTTIQDAKYIDGVEINCHPGYHNSYYENVLAEAKKHGLAVTVGCDYHADTKYRPHGGIIIPNDIKSDAELVKYILSTNEFELQIHEPDDERLFYKKFERG